jgi:hypothetical protein
MTQPCNEVDKVTILMNPEPEGRNAVRTGISILLLTTNINVHSTFPEKTRQK